MSTTPALPAPTQPPEKPAVTHETIDATGCGEAMKAALHAVLDGTPYREAANAAGLASHQDVYRVARKLGIAEVYSAQLVAGCRRNAYLANQELERRLVEDPESFLNKDLAVVTGIDLDKIAKYEGWGSSTRDPGAASAFVDRLSALEGKLTLNVTYERTHPEAATPPPIGVTPSKAAG